MTEEPSTKPPSPSPPRPPLKIRLLTAAVSAAYELSCRNNGTVNRRLLSCLDPPVSPNPSPVRHVATSDVTVDPSRNLYFRLFLPQLQNPADKIKKLPTIVFFHGGGFAMLSPASWGYDAVCRRFARRLSAVVLSVNYRLAPEHKFPAPYDDGIDVLRYLDDDAAAAAAVEEHADLSNVFLVGDSAGANIVHHVARRYLRSSRTRPWRRVKVRGLVLIQPFFGGEERTESEVRLAGAPLVSVERTDWCWRAFLPEGANRDHEAANVMKEEEDLEDEWPATMVVVGGWDPLQDWQRRYAEWLRKGRSRKEVRLVEYESAVHAFYILPGAKESGMVIEEIKGFMEGCSSESESYRREWK